MSNLSTYSVTLQDPAGRKIQIEVNAPNSAAAVAAAKAAYPGYILINVSRVS